MIHPPLSDGGYEEYAVSSVLERESSPSTHLDEPIRDELLVRRLVKRLVAKDPTALVTLRKTLSEFAPVGNAASMPASQVIKHTVALVLRGDIVLRRAPPPPIRLNPKSKYAAPEEELPVKTGPKTSFIRILLVDAADQPIEGEYFELALSDGHTIKARTGREGVTEARSIVEGKCDLSFPKVANDAWRHVGPSTTFVSFALYDADDNPLDGVLFEVLASNGTKTRGRTGPDGSAKVAEVVEGTCKLSISAPFNEVWKATS